MVGRCFDIRHRPVRQRSPPAKQRQQPRARNALPCTNCRHPRAINPAGFVAAHDLWRLLVPFKTCRRQEDLAIFDNCVRRSNLMTVFCPRASIAAVRTSLPPPRWKNDTGIRPVTHTLVVCFTVKKMQLIFKRGISCNVPFRSGAPVAHHQLLFARPQHPCADSICAEDLQRVRITSGATFSLPAQSASAVLFRANAGNRLRQHFTDGGNTVCSSGAIPPAPVRNAYLHYSHALP